MANKIKRYKVGMNSETYAISLVEFPAIESGFIALSKEEEEKQQIFLESNEKHLVIGPALIPDKDIYRNNGKNEFYINFSKDSIEKMAQDFMKEYRQYEVKTDHDKIADEVCVVESWLVSDSYKDKSNALGMTVPEGTWMVSLKVNNIETWDRIKSGELKGFSVESMISLEEFSKNDNNMEIETNDMKFWSKMKDILSEVFSSVSLKEEEVELEAAAAEPAPTVETNVVEEPKTVEEPKVETPTETPKEEPKQVVEEQPNDNHLEELVKSLKDEIEALKQMNNGLNDKVKELSKQPSAEPVNVNAKPSAPQNGVGSDTYTQWRAQMAKYLGY